MPKLYPCAVTITQGGQPLAGASVTLHPADAALVRWIPGGTTDQNGVCELRTLGRYSGAMAGSFKVTVDKLESEKSSLPDVAPPGMDPEELERQRDKEKLKSWRLVDKKYVSYKSTTLEIQVSEGKNAETFDVGASVREELPNN